MEISFHFLTEPKKLNLYLKDVDVETQLIITVWAPLRRVGPAFIST